MQYKKSASEVHAHKPKGNVKSHLMENSIIGFAPRCSTAANSCRSPEITTTFGTYSSKSRNARRSVEAPIQVSNCPDGPPHIAVRGTEEMTNLKAAVELTCRVDRMRDKEDL